MLKSLAKHTHCLQDSGNKLMFVQICSVTTVSLWSDCSNDRCNISSHFDWRRRCSAEGPGRWCNDNDGWSCSFYLPIRELFHFLHSAVFLQVLWCSTLACIVLFNCPPIELQHKWWNCCQLASIFLISVNACCSLKANTERSVVWFVPEDPFYILYWTV